MHADWEYVESADCEDVTKEIESLRLSVKELETAVRACAERILELGDSLDFRLHNIEREIAALHCTETIENVVEILPSETNMEPVDSNEEMLSLAFTVLSPGGNLLLDVSRRKIDLCIVSYASSLSVDDGLAVGFTQLFGKMPQALKGVKRLKTKIGGMYVVAYFPSGLGWRNYRKQIDEFDNSEKVAHREFHELQKKVCLMRRNYMPISQVVYLFLVAAAEKNGLLQNQQTSHVRMWKEFKRFKHRLPQ